MFIFRSRLARRITGPLTLAAAVAGGVLASRAAPAADWPTNRGNPNHTGSVDNKPGPKAPKVRWAFKSKEHFIAAPVPAGNALFVSGLGFGNAAGFYALALDGDAPNRVLWNKAGGAIGLPTVSAPAVVDGLVVFGDGMHQTNGATLYCLQADTGRQVWQLPVPGRLVHMEGAPAVEGGRVYIGAGDAGVICVDLKKMTLDGKSVDLPAAQKVLDQRWAELMAKYEKEKAKDGDLAIPPTEADLPKPAPNPVWQQGKGQWHVDAPVDVAGGKVLVASAYIDDDKVGKRVLACLNAADGKPQWETPLKINPWAGPTVAGDLVLVGCSSIRYDKKQTEGAAGEVVAVKVADGQVKWRQDVPGGVLAPVAVQDGVAVFASTDGKVRAVDAATGKPKWTYDGGGHPFFAGPAVAGGVVYAADLKGVAHAMNLADGAKQWTVDVVSDPMVQAPGMVFGSPVVHGGEVFLSTNNVEAEQNAGMNAVVCLSDKGPSLAAGRGSVVTVDKVKRTVTIPCKVAARKLPTLKEIYPLEVVACWPSPQGQKAHETVVVFDAKPSDIHKALMELGLRPGAPARGEGQSASGPEVGIYLSLPGVTGKPRLVPIEKAMVDRRTAKPMPNLKWVFTGSVVSQPDPEKPDRVYAADMTGTLISIFPVTDETVFQTNLTMKEEPLLKLDTNKNLLPEEGTAMELVIQAK